MKIEPSKSDDRWPKVEQRKSNSYISLLFFLFYALLSTAQNTLTLKIESRDQGEHAFIESVGYETSHLNYNTLNQTIATFEATLYQQGYFAFSKTDRVSNNLVTFTYQLGQRTTTLALNTHLLEDHVREITELRNSQLNIPVTETELYIQNTLNKLEQKGYGTSTLELINHHIENDTLHATLSITLNQKRTLDRIEIVSPDRIPTSLIQTSLKKELHRTFSEQTLERINDKIGSFNFIQASKPAETLFTQDSTYVYIYANKKNNNQFDGYIGFNNDDNGKIKANGYLNLELNNVLNQAERLELTWQNNGNQQADFSLSTEIPYLFKTPFAIKGALQIQKQDTLFQNSTTAIDVGYYINYNNRIFLGYQTLNSATTSNTSNAENLSNFYTTLQYEYKKTTHARPLYPLEQELRLKTGIGNRKTDTATTPQSYIEFSASKNIIINHTQLLYINWNNYYLKSDHYYFNELKRFGGMKTLRGFQENSLIASAYSTLNTEYRIQLGSNLALHTILDYALTKNPLSNSKNESLYAFGFGIKLLSNNTQFQIAFANGVLPNQKIKFDNTNIHINLTTLF